MRYCNKGVSSVMFCSFSTSAALPGFFLIFLTNTTWHIKVNTDIIPTNTYTHHKHNTSAHLHDTPINTGRPYCREFKAKTSMLFSFCALASVVLPLSTT